MKKILFLLLITFNTMFLAQSMEYSVRHEHIFIKTLTHPQLSLFIKMFSATGDIYLKKILSEIQRTIRRSPDKELVKKALNESIWVPTQLPHNNENYQKLLAQIKRQEEDEESVFDYMGDSDYFDDI